LMQSQQEASLEVVDKLFEDTPDSTISTTLPELDDIIAGLAREELVIVGGRPGMGKTALVVSMILEMANENPVMFFSMDMGKHQIWHRMLSQETKINLLRFKRRKDQQPFTMLEQEELRQARLRLLQKHMHIDDYGYYSLNALRGRIQQIVAQHSTRTIVIDHIGKIIAKGAFSREREVGAIVESLKRMAKEFNVSIVALSQLSRGVEGRAGEGGHKRPQMSDMRDSGSIEQEADIVLMPYRPEYYKLKTWEDGTSCMGQLDIMVEKNRNGPIESCRVGFVGNIARVVSRKLPTIPSFADMDE